MFVLSDRKEMLDSAESMIKDCEELIPKLKGIHDRFVEKQNEVRLSTLDTFTIVLLAGEAQCPRYT